MWNLVYETYGDCDYTAAYLIASPQGAIYDDFAPALAGAAARVLQMLMKNLYRQKKKQKQKTKKKML